jgi:L-alanine-DL-glutamate epimerase-like enolase superfamily enzyme
MKVSRVTTHVVNVPYEEPETWMFGRCWGLTQAIIEVETDDGLIGLGECPNVPTIDAVIHTVGVMSELLIGQDPHDIVPFLRKARTEQGWHHFPYLGNAVAATLEMALWDIVGKEAGQPLHALFGGLERRTVPYYFYIWIPNRDVETAKAQARYALEQGFRTMYLQIGFDVRNDVRLAEAVREEVGPDIAIRVDANEAWTPFEAIEALRAFEPVGLEFLEQPIDMHDLAGHAYLRSQTRTRIGANQSAWLPHQVPEVLAARAADVIVTDPHQLGGLSVFRDIAGMCEVARVPLVNHAFGDLGITTAATLHLLGGLPEPTLAHQTLLTLVEHDLLEEQFVFVDGSLPVPERPGLGVDLDRAALEHYGDLYRSIGELPAYAGLDTPSPFPAGLRPLAGAIPKAASAMLAASGR